MQNNQRLSEEIHDTYEQILEGSIPTVVKNSKVRVPYEFLASVDRGWIPCDILEVDSEKELVKVVFYHPDFNGWADVTGAAGVYDEVVEMWRVRLRED